MSGKQNEVLGTSSSAKPAMAAQLVAGGVADTSCLVCHLEAFSFPGKDSHLGTSGRS